MKKCFFVLALAMSFAGTGALADGEHIIVRVSGEGANRTEALERALRNAVRKAVGTYVVSQKTVRDEDFEEDIYVNADAVVTRHKELKKTEADGVVTLDIEAVVVKNDLLKYVKRTQSTKISSTDTANLIVKRRALRDAEKTLDYIFKDYAQKIYQMRKVGDFDIAPGDDVMSDNFAIIMSYDVVFDQNEYAKLKTRLQNLFDKVAIAAADGSFEKYDESKFRESYEKFWEKSGYDSNQGYRVVSFLEKGTGERYGMTAYVVPNQIHKKIVSLLGDACSAAIDFSFDVRHSSKPIRKILAAELSFWRRPYTDHLYDSDKRIVEFQNWMRMKVDGYKKASFETNSYKKSWTFSEDEVGALKQTTIRAFSGAEALYLRAKSDKNSSRMYDLAYDGYVPAQISMNDDFGRKNEDWLKRAALRNSRHAQVKLEWKNSGLGFSIVRNGDQFVVADVQKGVPVKRDMVLKAVNGESVSNRDYESMSALVGAIPAGSVVHLEFSNGKIADVTAQD